MPWLLRPATSDSRELSWDRDYDENGVLRYPQKWSDADVVPTAEYWPMKFVQSSAHKQVPDFCAAASYGALYVSRAVKELIQAMDPVTHHYVPLHLVLKDGRETVDEHFLFKFGSFIDGVMEEESEVGPMYNRHGRLGFYSTAIAPKIVWRADAIAGRHVWADRYMKNRFFCSDEFLTEIEKRKMGLFNKTESFVAPARGTEHVDT